jgi:hypothetical protein
VLHDYTHFVSLQHSLSLTISLIIYQLTLGPGDSYIRPPSVRITEPTPEFAIAGDSAFSRTSFSRPARLRRASSTASRRSYAVPDDADDEDLKAAMEGNKEDPIVGIMFDKGVWEQIRSSWWL